MQSEEVDILGALTSLLRTIKETNVLGSKPIEQWPTFLSVIDKNENVEGDEVYQMQVLKKYDVAICHFQSTYADMCLKIMSCIKQRLQSFDVNLMRDIIFFLATHGWQKIVQDMDATGLSLQTCNSESDDTHGSFDPIDRLTEQFEVPLEGARAQIMLTKAEFEAMIVHANQFISLSTMSYKNVWWRIF